MRTILIFLTLAGGAYLAFAPRWEVLLGTIFFTGFTLVVLVAFLYRDPRRRDDNLADE